MLLSFDPKTVVFHAQQFSMLLSEYLGFNELLHRIGQYSWKYRPFVFLLPYMLRYFELANHFLKSSRYLYSRTESIASAMELYFNEINTHQSNPA